MNENSVIAVTGASGYSGKRIAQRLLDQGHDVLTLTNNPQRAHPFGDRIRVAPFNFDAPEKLTESLRGVSVLINTYWVRFNHRRFTFAEAVRNTETLFRCAKEAGVERIVHSSITNPSESSPLEYFRGKARLERALHETGVSHAILRPAVLFGGEDILINNIAWGLRRFPIFFVFGDGRYRLQPIHVDDFADLAVAQAAQRESVVVNAIGPETFTYRGLAETLGEIIGKKRKILTISPGLGYIGAWAIGKMVGDVLLTREEISGLMADLLFVEGVPPAGPTRLTDWARENAVDLGRRYVSELGRRPRTAAR
jgi:NADH dehydrogenase